MPISRPSTSAFAHAKALLELAEERRSTHQVADELAGLGSLLDGNAEFRAFFSSPSIGDTDRERVLRSSILPRVGPLVSSFLELLLQKGKLALMPEISRAFAILLDERAGKADVVVTVARKLSPGELDQVRQRISTAIKKEAIVDQKVDESIIGGIVIRVGDTLIDGSVKAQLDALSKKLVTAR
jgi:F-type H+-transporting ATPase subunit delta